MFCTSRFINGSLPLMFSLSLSPTVSLLDLISEHTHTHTELSEGDTKRVMKEERKRDRTEETHRRRETSSTALLVVLVIFIILLLHLGILVLVFFLLLLGLGCGLLPRLRRGLLVFLVVVGSLVLDLLLARCTDGFDFGRGFDRVGDVLKGWKKEVGGGEGEREMRDGERENARKSLKDERTATVSRRKSNMSLVWMVRFLSD